MSPRQTRARPTSGPSLRDLQTAFWRSLASGEPEPALLRVIRPSGALRPEERVDLYAGMYLGRIVDALREDFPRLAAILGDDAFADLVRRYLGSHPSSHPSLRHAGRRLPDFVAGESALPRWAADLARLEWARVEVFDAPDAAAVTTDELRAVPPEEWPALRFTLVPACAVLTAAWPVAEIWEAASPAVDTLRPARTPYRVWRDGFRVYHAAMDRPEEAALAQVGAGVRFDAFCEPFGSAAEAAALLLRWIEDGILIRA